MKRIIVDLHRRDYATVYFVPSIVERIIGRRTTERAAVFDGRAWTWASGRPVIELRVLRALSDAVRDRIVDRLITRGSSPPS